MKKHVLLAAVAAVLSGCATGVPKTFTISGGEVVRVPVYKELPFAASGGWSYDTDDIRGLHVSDNRIGSGERDLVYHFSFAVLQHDAFPTSVKIEDVTDPKAQLLLLDKAPKLRQAEGSFLATHPPRSWSGNSDPMTLTDSRLQWLLSDENSVRIHRFTITMNTGKTIVAYYTLNYQRGTKKQMRSWLQ